MLVTFKTRKLDYLGGSGEELGHALNLAPLGTRAAPHIMVGHTLAHDYIEYLCLGTGTAGNTAVDDEIGTEIVDHRQCAYRSVDLSDAALHHHHILVVEGSAMKHDVIDRQFTFIAE